MRSNWDAEVVKNAILPHLATLAKEWGVKLTGKRSAKGWLECHAIDREDAIASAGINATTGTYKDQGGGGKPISVFALAVKLGAFRDFPSAVNGLGERYGVPAKNGTAGSPFKGTALGSDSSFVVRAVGGSSVEVPAPPKRIGHPTFDAALLAVGRSPKVKGEYQAHWTYHNADGSESFRIVRFQTPKGKTYRPIHGADGSGWLAMDPPGLLPLYRLPELAGDGPVLVLEGEKVAELARDLGLAATTSAHGAGSAAKSDWSPLAGRQVVIVPDHGKAGEGYAAEIVKQLARLDRKPSVRLVRLPDLAEGEDLEQWLERVPDLWDVERCRQELLKLAEPAVGPDPAPDVEPVTLPITNRFDLGILGMVAFSNADYPREWLIKRVLVKGKPGVIGGPKKTLKTSFIVDLAVSLGGAGRFLDQFDVPRPVKTLVISGESGEATIQETMRRICRSKEIHPPDLEGFVFWGFTLPQLGSREELGSMGEFIRSNGVECVVIDPLYLCLINGGRRIDPANLFDVGPLLKTVCDTCLDAGATPLMAHHFRKNRETPFGVPDMEDMAFAGIQEFARQWILLGRRERYEPGSGEHRLWLSVGGSDGHSGEWSVDVSEGVLKEDFRDREWRVSIASAVETIKKAKEDATRAKGNRFVENAKTKDLAKERKIHDDAERALDILSKASPQRMTKKGWRTTFGCNSERMDCIVAILVRQGRIGPVEEVKTIGEDGKERTYPGYEFLTNNLPEDLF